MSGGAGGGEAPFLFFVQDGCLKFPSSSPTPCLLECRGLAVKLLWPWLLGAAPLPLPARPPRQLRAQTKTPGFATRCGNEEIKCGTGAAPWLGWVQPELVGAVNRVLSQTLQQSARCPQRRSCGERAGKGGRWGEGRHSWSANARQNTCLTVCRKAKSVSCFHFETGWDFCFLLTVREKRALSGGSGLCAAGWAAALLLRAALPGLAVPGCGNLQTRLCRRAAAPKQSCLGAAWPGALPAASSSGCFLSRLLSQ